MNSLHSFRYVIACLVSLCGLLVSQDCCFGQSQPTAFAISFYTPTNGQNFTAPTNVHFYVRLTDSNAVRTVQYFSGTNSIAIVTNTSGAILTNNSVSTSMSTVWSNIPPGSYTFTAVATDATGATATSAPVNITVKSPPPPPPVPFVVGFYYPTNGQTFTAPTNLYIHASVTDSNVVQSVQYFSGTNSLAIITNKASVLLTNTSTGNPFAYIWSNVPPGNYTFTAVATDSAGATATSGPVNITVKSPPPPPPVPFFVGFYYPTNGQIFTGPTNIGVHASVTDSNIVRTVQYFSGNNSIGIVTNTSGVLLTNSTSSNPFYLLWSNVPPGSYTLTAVATDTTGATATSGPVNITVKSPPPPPPVPFETGFYYPTNGQVFTGPTNIGVHAAVIDSNVVRTVQYFSGSNSIGIVTNTSGVLLTNSTALNPFFLLWSNVPPGSYTLTAVATDIAGATATSGPVRITVVSNAPPTNLPPVVSIYATDPVAIEGTNNTTGTNTATFLVRRDSGTNTSLTVYYLITGTASNGVDYVTIANHITLPPGQRYGTITITPLPDNDTTNHYESVILSLTYPTNITNTALFPYRIGTPAKAGAVILEENVIPITKPLVHSFADLSVHISLPATNGMNYCVQFATNFNAWTSICTNTVVKGSAQFVDPDASTRTGAMYRIIPTPAPATY